MKISIWIFLALFCLVISCTKKPDLIQPELGHRVAPLVEIEGYQFKDLNKNGIVDPSSEAREWGFVFQTKHSDITQFL